MPYTHAQLILSRFLRYSHFYKAIRKACDQTSEGEEDTNSELSVLASSLFNGMEGIGHHSSDGSGDRQEG